MVSLGLIATLSVAYATLAFALISTRSARSETETGQKIEKDAATLAGSPR
jgi:hypothetical protein